MCYFQDDDAPDDDDNEDDDDDEDDDDGKDKKSNIKYADTDARKRSFNSTASIKRNTTAPGTSNDVAPENSHIDELEDNYPEAKKRSAIPKVCTFFKINFL